MMMIIIYRSSYCISTSTKRSPGTSSQDGAAPSYTQTSLCAAGALLYYALRNRQQWYSGACLSEQFQVAPSWERLDGGCGDQLDIVTNTFYPISGVQEAEGLQDFFFVERDGNPSLPLTMFLFRNSASDGGVLILYHGQTSHHVAILRTARANDRRRHCRRPLGAGGMKPLWILQQKLLSPCWCSTAGRYFGSAVYRARFIDQWSHRLGALFIFEAAILPWRRSHILLWYFAREFLVEL
jgi:hypothetical protein